MGFLFVKQPVQRFRSRSTQFKALVLIALAGLSIATAATVYAVVQNTASNRGIIMFVGDSNISYGARWPVRDLTYGPSPDNPNHLDNSYVPVFVARAQFGIREYSCNYAPSCPGADYWKVKLGQTFTKVKPDAIVNDLGINDTVSAGTATTRGYSYYGQKIDYFMKLVPSTTKVFWTNLPCNIEPSARLNACNIVNYSLGVAPQRWPNLTIINWAYAANSHPEYMDTTMPADTRVHYSDEGYAAWANMVMNALDAKFPVQ